MDVICCDTSSDDEDFCYTNSVTKLKVLKEKSSNIRHIPEDERKIKPQKQEKILAVVNVANYNDVIEDATSGLMITEQLPRKSKRIKQKRVTVPEAQPKLRNRRKKKNVLDSDLDIISVDDDAVICVDGNDSFSISSSLNTINNEDDDFPIDVKIYWRYRSIVHFELHQHESFQKVFEHFAAIESVPVENIVITRKELRISRNDSPASINLSVIDILEGGISDLQSAGQSNDNECVDETMCKIKIQLADKRKLVVMLKNDQKFKTVFLSCAEQLKLQESRIKLLFDGEEISDSDTPESLDLEQEACIDLRVLT
ncbi:uncharacterized protein CG4449 [Cephus cinctus]|uniref:Uncharacterized protein CG4449 n=1 Tax=Cephus cinctus TaxID=211228 RepID=A0AAJ7VWT4_CEPCN|nr:uncharacterized protein CG4449 [Cephus cinctus]XP_015585177.1 uncharacterized protein CG4449 [Cephus cinctus]XP_015585178.1 uncharacterized protein CG4449 [Cephus cinctus]XP_024936021.1 uncharacterized protein CG4449 [Cephus cinctus]